MTISLRFGTTHPLPKVTTPQQPLPEDSQNSETATQPSDSMDQFYEGLPDLDAKQQNDVPKLSSYSEENSFALLPRAQLRPPSSTTAPTPANGGTAKARSALSAHQGLSPSLAYLPLFRLTTPHPQPEGMKNPSQRQQKRRSTNSPPVINPNGSGRKRDQFGRFTHTHNNPQQENPNNGNQVDDLENILIEIPDQHLPPLPAELVNPFRVKSSSNLETKGTASVSKSESTQNFQVQAEKKL